MEFQGRRLRKRRGTAGADGARAAPSQARAGHPQPPRARGDRGGRGSWPTDTRPQKGKCRDVRSESRAPGARELQAQVYVSILCWSPALELDSREQPWARSHARHRLPEHRAAGPSLAPCQGTHTVTTALHHEPRPPGIERACTAAEGTGVATQPAGSLGTGPGHSTGHRRDRSRVS